MVNFVIIDHGVEGTDGPRRNEMGIDGNSISLYTLMDLVDERLGLAPDTYNLVMDGEILLECDFEDAPAPTEIHLYRDLDDDVKVPVMTTYQGESVHSVLAAGTIVEEYQRFLARRFLVDEEVARPDKVFLSVKRRREPGYLTFVMDDDEIFDMLAGRLEREGEVREGEEVTFLSDGTIFDNWKTLGEYKLTIAKLRISD